MSHEIYKNDILNCTLNSDSKGQKKSRGHNNNLSFNNLLVAMERCNLVFVHLETGKKKIETTQTSRISYSFIYYRGHL